MDMVEKALKKKRPVRIRVLKARQMGFSTLISALGFLVVGDARKYELCGGRP